MPDEAFTASWERFGSVVAFLGDPRSRELTHAELERRLEADAREVFCQLLQDHLDMRAAGEERLPDFRDAHAVARTSVEDGHERGLATVFGEVVVARRAYRGRGQANLHPADAALNLPAEKHSHGLRRLAAIESTRGSFDAAVAAIWRATGQRLGKRQVQDLAVRAAADIDEFYATRVAPPGADTDVLGLSADAKGIVMLPEALREATARAATSRKLSTRLSAGEKRNRKRMAEIGAVFDAAPAPRTPADVITPPGQPRPDTAPGPQARNKWLTASVTADAAEVITAIFDEATRRDSYHKRTSAGRQRRVRVGGKPGWCVDRAGRGDDAADDAPDDAAVVADDPVGAAPPVDGESRAAGDPGGDGSTVGGPHRGVDHREQQGRGALPRRPRR